MKKETKPNDKGDDFLGRAPVAFIDFVDDKGVVFKVLEERDLITHAYRKFLEVANPFSEDEKKKIDEMYSALADEKVLESVEGFATRILAAQKYADRVLSDPEIVQSASKIYEHRRQHHIDRIADLELHARETVRTGLLSGEYIAYGFGPEAKYQRLPIPGDWWTFLDLDFERGSAKGGGMEFVGLLVAEREHISDTDLEIIGDKMKQLHFALNTGDDDWDEVFKKISGGEPIIEIEEHDSRYLQILKGRAYKGETLPDWSSKKPDKSHTESWAIAQEYNSQAGKDIKASTVYNVLGREKAGENGIGHGYSQRSKFIHYEFVKMVKIGEISPDLAATSEAIRLRVEEKFGYLSPLTAESIGKHFQSEFEQYRKRFIQAVIEFEHKGKISGDLDTKIIQEIIGASKEHERKTGLKCFTEKALDKIIYDEEWGAVALASSAGDA